MVNAVVSQAVDEITVMRVPSRWEVFPREWQEQLGYWHVIRSLQLQENVVMFGGPRDFVWLITRDPAELRALELRHPCEDCQEAQESAARLLEADRRELIAFVQFTQDYLYPVGRVPTEYAVVGDLSRHLDLGLKGEQSS